jgi:valyl-tRNA synthetase
MWDDFCDWYLEVAKSRIQAGQAAPKAVLAYCLDQFLRMLHPVCPFITEAIWDKLNEIVPDRLGTGDIAGMLVAAPWPEAKGDWIDADAEARFDLLRDLTRQIRNVRTEHNVAPSRRVDAIIEPGEHGAFVETNLPLVVAQAGLGQATIAPATQGAPNGAATVSAGGIRVHLLEIIDREAELARLSKQRDQLSKAISGIEGKLGNEKFISKAPADVVERERTRLAEYQAELATIEQAIAALG